MKKLFALTLALCMLIGLVGCSKTPAETTAPAVEKDMAISVGFGRADITPTISVPLAGYGNTTTRMSQGVLDNLYATSVCISDADGNTIILITVDIISIREDWALTARNRIAKKTGVPKENISITATHTHSGPDTGSSYDDGMTTYKETYIAGVLASAEAAYADLAPATIKSGTTKTEGLNFVRHYLLSDGSYYGDNFGDRSAGSIVGHATPADEEMQLIRFVREDESKKDILMVNWQAHPKLASTASTAYGKEHRPLISSDYVGPCREKVEKETGCLFAFYLGASGNLNPLSDIKEENPCLDHDVYGELVADVVIAGLDKLTDTKTGAVKHQQHMYEAQIDHTEDHLYEEAVKIRDLWNATNNYNLCAEAGKPYGIVSPYHAGSIVSRHDNTDTMKKMEINAFNVGGISFVTAPYEMFDTNGMYIKDNAPQAVTFVMSCSNGANSYIASEAAFGYSSYEVHNRKFIRGTAEGVASKLVDMLKELNPGT